MNKLFKMKTFFTQHSKKNTPQVQRHLTFWQLACILSATSGVQGILINGQLGEQYGPGAAILSICIGNLILWVIGLGSISMAAQNRKNAVENVRTYFGNGSATLSAWIFILAFLIWYMLQIHATVEILDLTPSLKGHGQQHLSINSGVLLGLFTALLAAGGIRLISWISISFFPVLILYFLYLLLRHEASITLTGSWGFSFHAIATTIIIKLPGIVNLPTFFRHARARNDSYLALTLITVFLTFVETTCILISNFFFQDLFYPQNSSLQIMTAVTFTSLLLICSNLVNIYYASASWEAIIPHFCGTKLYMIIGIAGTISYSFVHLPMEFLINLLTSFIAILGMVLPISFLVSVIIKHRPRIFEKLISTVSWLFGCVIVAVLEIHNPQNVHNLLTGILGSVLLYLFILFIEETIWSMKKIENQK